MPRISVKFCIKSRFSICATTPNCALARRGFCSPYISREEFIVVKAPIGRSACGRFRIRFCPIGFCVDTHSQFKYNLRNPLGWTALKAETGQGGQPEKACNCTSPHDSRASCMPRGRTNSSQNPANCDLGSRTESQQPELEA